MLSQIDILNIQKITLTSLVSELKDLYKSLSQSKGTVPFALVHCNSLESCDPECFFPLTVEKRKKVKKEHKRSHEKEKEKEKERSSKKRKADETLPNSMETTPQQSNSNALPLNSEPPRRASTDTRVERAKEKAESLESVRKNPVDAEGHMSDGSEDISISIVDQPVANLKDEEEGEVEPPVLDEVTFLQTHQPLPDIPAIQGSFPKELVGDLLAIMEFVSAFGSDLSLNYEELPAGMLHLRKTMTNWNPKKNPQQIILGRLSEMISGTDFVSLVLNLTKVLLQELVE